MANRQNLVLLTRLGFAARGFLYLVIAWLLIATGRSTDLSGALDHLASGEDRLLLGAIAVGFVAYGLWRLLDALVDSEGLGGRSAVGRIAAAGSGIVYLFLAYHAWKLLSGDGDGGDGGGVDAQARTVQDLPAGGLLLGIGAAVLLAAGIWQLVKAGKCTFLKHLAGPVRGREWVRWLGRIGYGARGIIFLVSAYFLAQAALSGTASKAGGMEEALRWLESPVNLIVAAGLALFGIFSLIEARYRTIDTASIDAAARAATAKL